MTAEGLKCIYKDFKLSGDRLIEQLRTFKRHGAYVLGSFIFGLPSDRAETFESTSELAKKAELTFAQFVTLTPFPGTVDFARWEKSMEGAAPVQRIPVTRYWLIPGHLRPKLYIPHVTMSREEIRSRTQGVWDAYYKLSAIWKRTDCVKSWKARLAFVLISKLYRQMYANTGIATDSARREAANRWVRRIAPLCRRLFHAAPMPDLSVPSTERQPFAIATR